MKSEIPRLGWRHPLLITPQTHPCPPADLPDPRVTANFYFSMQRTLNPISAIAMAAVFSLPAGADDGIAFFEKNVRPVLVNRCYKCHSADAEKIKGGLQLDSKPAWMAGGESGPVILPGDAENSLFVQAVRYTNPDLEMPPKGKLQDHEIAALENWVAMGAPDPRMEGALVQAKEGIDIEAGREFWAFKPLKQPTIPTAANGEWPLNEIDYFIASKHNEAGIIPVTDAEDRDLLRRVYYDLIGLPPSPEQIRSYLADTREDRFENLVDELLASPRFGEKWGRHWLDLARYAESTGGGRSAILGNAWRYRNYIINSFNADKPFDQFMREQIAGDLMTADSDEQRAEQIIATAYLALGPKNLDLQDKELLRMNTVDEQIDTVGRTFLGMTLGCARCHDHKFDPVPMADYYAMAGIFRSTRTLVRQNVSTLIETQLPVEQARLEEDQKYKAAAKALQDWIKEIKENDPKSEETKTQLASAEAALNDLKQTEPKPLPKAISVDDEKETGDYHICVRGNVHQKGDRVARGFLQVASQEEDFAPSISEKESGRSELADWLASPSNPLPARVYVNRLWHHVFGEGIVKSVDNFGFQGDRPTHPELLDFLAATLIENGWSTKEMVRLMITSRTYRLSSELSEANRKIDPENRLRWRMPRRRLDAEALRDTILLVSGQLELNQPDCLLPEAAQRESALARAELDIKTIINPPYRSVYIPVFREEGLNGLMEVFDFANPSFTAGSRNTSTLPTQALYLMNSPFVMEQSKAAAQSLIESEQPGLGHRITTMFESTIGRPPSSDELQLMNEVLEGEPNNPDRWAMLYHTLFASVDFRYLR